MRWEKQIPFTRWERGFSVTEACGDGLTQFSAVVHYEVGAFSSEGQRQVRCITGHQSRVQPAPLHQRLLKSPNRFRHNVDIDPHKTTHDVLELAFVEITCSPNASAMCSHQEPVPGSAGYSTG
jgi:hypothetical protein